jgi:hypothetical protein
MAAFFDTYIVIISHPIIADDFVAFCKKKFRKMKPNESSGPGYKYSTQEEFPLINTLAAMLSVR